MNEIAAKPYPDIAQSFGIAGINILAMLLMSPLNFILKDVIGIEAAMLIYYLLGIGISFSIVHLIRLRKTGSSTFNTEVNKRIVPFLAITTLALLFGIIMPLASLIPMPDSIKKTFMELGSQTGILAFITMVIAAPIFEELIFRGIILDGLLKKYTPLKSILISSLLFGLVHLNPWQFITGFVIGIFAGWVYYKTHSVLHCIIIHAAANLAGFSVRLIVHDVKSFLDMSMLEMYGGWTNFVLVIIGSCIVILACIWFLKREFLRKTAAEIEENYRILQ